MGLNPGGLIYSLHDLNNVVEASWIDLFTSINMIREYVPLNTVKTKLERNLPCIHQETRYINRLNTEPTNSMVSCPGELPMKGRTENRIEK